MNNSSLGELMSKALLKKRVARLLPSDAFARGVSVLVGGTFLAQLVGILSLPLLTRLYTPGDFSNLAVYSSILSLLTVIACLRFEIAIPLPKSDKIAGALFLISLFNVLWISLLVAVVVSFLPFFDDLFFNDSLSDYFWLIPFGVFVVGMYNATQYWSSRKKRFSIIAKTRIEQSLAGNSVKLLVGFFGGGAPGLILGQAVSQGAGFVKIGLSVLRNDFKVLEKVNVLHFRIALRRYKKFPTYSVMESFANAAAMQVPLLLIAYYAEDAEVGFLMVAMQLLSTPIKLIGKSFSQVFLTEASSCYHKGRLRSFVISKIVALAKISILPVLLLAIFSPVLLPYVLGEEWHRSGVLVAWMAPWFFMQFITSPVSMSLHINNKQEIAFILQLVGFLLRVGSVLIFAILYPEYVGEVYAISGLFFYFIYLAVILIVVDK